MNSFILNPMLFFGSLIVLFVIAVVVALISLRQDNKGNELDCLLKQEITAREELEKNFAALTQERDNLKKELILKEELYHGLKGQYGDLEKDLERLNQAPQQTATPPQEKREESDSKNSIIDLLKSLNKTENT
jgi:hypothetical protein